MGSHTVSLAQSRKGSRESKRTFLTSATPGVVYSGWIVVEWIPQWCSASWIWAATCIKSYSLDAEIWTEATTLVSDNCQTWSSCKERTPLTWRIDLRTSPSAMLEGTP